MKVKFLITCSIILCTLTSFSQNDSIEITLSERTLNAPIGLTFGMSTEKAKAFMLRKNVKLDTKYSKKDKLFYNNVKVGSKTADFITLLFVDNKLFDVTIYYDVTNGRIQETYDLLKETIDNKYAYVAPYRNFDKPYFDGDGYEMQAIKLGKGSISTYWGLKNGTISLVIEQSLEISIGYQEINLAAIYFNRKKKKEAADF
jgi:hypothetical protein